MSNQKSTDINSSRSMGNWGNYPIVSASKTFDPKEVISVIEVKVGTADVTGKQNAENVTGYRELPAWSAITLAVGTHIVNLKEVTVDASSSTLTVCHYGG
jgi:hypothetical protein